MKTLENAWFVNWQVKNWKRETHPYLNYLHTHPLTLGLTNTTYLKVRGENPSHYFPGLYNPTRVGKVPQTLTTLAKDKVFETSILTQL